MTLSKEQMKEYQRNRRATQKGKKVQLEISPDAREFLEPNQWAEIFRRLDNLEKLVKDNLNVTIDNERLKCPPIETKVLKTKEDAVLAVRPLVEMKPSKPRGHAVNCTCWSCRPPKI